MLSSSPHFFWKYTRDLSQIPAIPSSVHLKNERADSQLDSANLLLKFFHSTFNTPLSSLVNSSHGHSYPFSFPYSCNFTLDDVQSALNSLKNNRSNGPDGISALILYNCRNSLVSPIYNLFRRSLDEGIFPAVWKICSIPPIIKSGDSSLVSNYRPI